MFCFEDSDQSPFQWTGDYNPVPKACWRLVKYYPAHFESDLEFCVVLYYSSAQWVVAAVAVVFVD